MKEAFEKYFQNVISDIEAQNQKVPVKHFEIDATDKGAKLIGPDWFQYMIFGRGPGKFPPPDRMRDWVKRNPDILAEARQRFKHITENGLAYIIGRKIATSGTDIYQNKRKGVDFLGSLEKFMPDLLEQLAVNETLKITSSFQKALK